MYSVLGTFKGFFINLATLKVAKLKSDYFWPFAAGRPTAPKSRGFENRDFLANLGGDVCRRLLAPTVDTF